MLARPEMERFSRHGVFRPDAVFRLLKHSVRSSHAASHRCDEPTRLSLGMVASLHSSVSPGGIIVALMTTNYKVSWEPRISGALAFDLALRIFFIMFV